MTIPNRQRGITLVTALIMLVLLTLLALTSFNLGRSNLQIVSNMQQRDEAVSAAHEVIEETISNTRFFVTPDNILANPCGAPNQRCVDTNADGKPDVTVALVPKPKCVKAPVIKNSALDLSVREDAECIMGSAQNFGLDGADNGSSSACADSVWEVTAVATDAQSAAQVKVVQGVAVRIAKDDVLNNCPD